MNIATHVVDTGICRIELYYLAIVGDGQVVLVFVPVSKAAYQVAGVIFGIGLDLSDNAGGSPRRIEGFVKLSSRGMVN
jgi:hypothetical protein